MEELAKNYAFHDGNLDGVSLETDSIKLKLELLKFSSDELEELELQFFGVGNAELNGLDQVDWGNSSGTILKYSFDQHVVSLFIELSNYVDVGIDQEFFNLDFSFQNFEVKTF